MAGMGCDPNEDGLERLLQVSGVVRLVAEPKFLILKGDQPRCLDHMPQTHRDNAGTLPYVLDR